ncbi:MAG: hypothetical protein CK425_01960 [Parachlamydia sp.]|nr:MAG: hypothetical protein CK425_01960 [Parachlamydia sp.]
MKNPDKALIVAALLIVLALFPFKDRILEEVVLLNQVEVLSKKIVSTYFYPVSREERVHLLKDSIKKMNEMQEKISRSIVAKYFINFQDLIQESEENLLVLENQEFYEDFVSFLTSKLANVIASRRFSNEQLLQLGHLIDQEFTEEPNQSTYLFDRDESNDQLFFEIIHHQNIHSIEEARFQLFVDKASGDIFRREPIILRVSSEKNLSEYITLKSS